MDRIDIDAVKDRMAAEIDARADLLLDVSHRIHATPELNFEEHHAHDLLCEVLDDQGIPPERGAHGMKTAFTASAGSTGPNIALCLEYDALPGMGHACGHNIIAAAGLGAGLAAAALADDCGGRVRVLGTPAEEGGGGKVFLVRQGAFSDVDAALMIHPADTDQRRMMTIAVQQCVATYTGQAAHASAAPHRGHNALDAAVLGYLNIAALRQHIRPDERIHGVFTDGGDKPNIVPARAETFWFIRSPDMEGLEDLRARVAAALVAGATAAGCDATLRWVDPPFSDMLDVQVLVDRYATNAARLGREVLDPTSTVPVVGSTDMGNVSYEVPAIHPMIKAADPGVAIHTEAFADCAASDLGDRAVIDGAKILAWTVADLWLEPGLLDAARAEHAGLRRGRPSPSTPR